MSPSSLKRPSSFVPHGVVLDRAHRAASGRARAGAGKGRRGNDRRQSRGAPAKNDTLAPIPAELPLTGPTGPSVNMLWLDQAIWAEGMVEVLAEALWLKNNPLALFPMELPLMGPNGSSVATVALEIAWGQRGWPTEALQLKKTL